MKYLRHIYPIETFEEAESIINRQPAINGHSEANYALHKALNYVNKTITSQFRTDSKRYCFVIDVGGYPAADVTMGAVPTLKENNVVIGFSYNRGNPNAEKYTLLATNALCEQAVICGGRYNFGDFIVNEIFGNHENEYPIVSAVGWKWIQLNAPITENYKSAAMPIENDPELREQVVALNKYADTDKDGLLDLEEIYYERNDKTVISWNADGNVILPTFGDCVDMEKSLFYVERGLLRFFGETGITDYSQFDEIRILSIKSDPINSDSDGDGDDDIIDKNPLKYQLNDTFIYYTSLLYKVAIVVLTALLRQS